MYYRTGDTHGDLSRIVDFCKEHHLTEKDTMIILGDVGLNYYKDSRSYRSKVYYTGEITCTLFCIHGNHEMNPEYMDSMKEKEWNGGIVYYEEDFPTVLYAKDGEIYDLDGKKAVVLGGAYSIDKEYRLMMGWNWFADEQMTKEVMERCEDNLEKVDWKVDYVLSHTVPLSVEPVEFFLNGIDQSKVDKTMEIWLESIRERLTYDKWFAGHYHCEVEKPYGVEIMFHSIKELDKEYEYER